MSYMKPLSLLDNKLESCYVQKPVAYVNLESGLFDIPLAGGPSNYHFFNPTGMGVWRHHWKMWNSKV